MSPGTPTIAIIVAACNASATIARAVRSALAEPEVSEVIVVDDASGDNTVAIAHTADDKSGRLKILTQPKNTGPAAARNRALRESRADWIGILDADDFFMPGRIGKLLAYADRADFIADDACQVFEDALDGPRKSLLGLPLTAAHQVGFAEFVLSNVTDTKRPRGELGFLKPLMRRSFLAGHGIEYREALRLGEDYELYARALAMGAYFWLTPIQGYVSVVRPNSLSGRHTEKDLLMLRDSDRLLGEMPDLTPREKDALCRHYLSVDCRLQWRLLISAVKNRDFIAGLKTFARPYPVPFYLLARLAEQIVERTTKMLTGRRR
jgi:succinoglycan biosynthesis protein ExoU